MTALVSHRGYKLTVRDRQPPVEVHDPRYPRDGAVFLAETLDDARDWIDAYIDGRQWAVDAKLSPRKGDR